MTLLEKVFDAVCWFERPLHGDERGEFSRLFCSQVMARYGLETDICQVNHATNAHNGTLRGMHYQIPPAAETKYVSCIQGKVFDVVVDLRKGSETFLKWHGFELSQDFPTVLAIPAGFAHGYLTLTDNSQLIYAHTAHYQPDFEAAIRFDDPALAIRWPEIISVISERDQSHPLISDEFQGVTL